jgi:hypothetical protein
MRRLQDLKRLKPKFNELGNKVVIALHRANGLSVGLARTTRI